MCNNMKRIFTPTVLWSYSNVDCEIFIKIKILSSHILNLEMLSQIIYIDSLKSLNIFELQAILRSTVITS